MLHNKYKTVTLGRVSATIIYILSKRSLVLLMSNWERPFVD